MEWMNVTLHLVKRKNLKLKNDKNIQLTNFIYFNFAIDVYQCVLMYDDTFDTYFIQPNSAKTMSRRIVTR